MNIKDFRKGEIITRVVPEIELSSGGGFSIFPTQTETKNYDRVGRPVEFVGIANGLIYYLENGKTQSLPFEKCKDGWEKYINPETL